MSLEFRRYDKCTSPSFERTLILLLLAYFAVYSSDSAKIVLSASLTVCEMSNTFGVVFLVCYLTYSIYSLHYFNFVN